MVLEFAAQSSEIGPAWGIQIEQAAQVHIIQNAGSANFNIRELYIHITVAEAAFNRRRRRKEEPSRKLNIQFNDLRMLVHQMRARISLSGDASTGAEQNRKYRPLWWKGGSISDNKVAE
jgi:hypothetical protein